LPSTITSSWPNPPQRIFGVTPRVFASSSRRLPASLRMSLQTKQRLMSMSMMAR
jgi:hypothetical protein